MILDKRIKRISTANSKDDKCFVVVSLIGTSLQDLSPHQEASPHPIIVVRVEHVGSTQIELVIFDCFYFSYLFYLVFCLYLVLH